MAGVSSGRARGCAPGWRIGIVNTGTIRIGGVQVVGERLAAVPAPAGGSVIDAEARAAIDAVLARLQEHGLIEA